MSGADKYLEITERTYSHMEVMYRLGVSIGQGCRSSHKYLKVCSVGIVALVNESFPRAVIFDAGQGTV